MKKQELNENDRKLLAFCRREFKSVGEIAEFLNIKQSNVSVRLKKLKDENLIEIQEQGPGKKTLIKTKTTKTDKDYIVQLLQEIKLKGGIVDEMAFVGMPDIYPNAPDYQQKLLVNSYVRFSNLVSVQLLLTDEGEKFLKENSKTTQSPPKT